MRIARRTQVQTNERSRIHNSCWPYSSPRGAESQLYVSCCRLCGESVQWIFRVVRQSGHLFLAVLRAAVTPPYEWRELIRQLDEVGSKSLPLVAMAGAAIGVILSLEARYSLTRFGAKSMFPATIVYSVIQVMGPMVTGLVVSGRVGAGMGAELASMKVTEQIDAVEASRDQSLQTAGGDTNTGMHPDVAPADPCHRRVRLARWLVCTGLGLNRSRSISSSQADLMAPLLMHFCRRHSRPPSMA